MKQQLNEIILMFLRARFIFFFTFFLLGVFFIFSPAHAAFTMSVAPASGQTDIGNPISFVATATYASPPTENIGFNVLGANASYSTGSCTPTCSTIVTIDTAGMPAGNHIITVQGLGSSTASTTYSLTLADPAIGALITQSLTHTSDSDFSGTHSNTAVSGTGASAGVTLSGTSAIPAPRSIIQDKYSSPNGYTSLDAIDANTLAVAYMQRIDNFNYQPRFSTSTDSGTSWTETIIDTPTNSGANGSNISLKALDANTFFTSYVNGSLGTLKFAKSTGGAWTVSTVDSSGAVGSAGGNYTSLDATDANTLFIAYYDTTNADLKFATSVNGGSSWTTSTVDSTGIVGKYASLDAVSDSTPGDGPTVFISYEDGTNTNLKLAKSTDGGTTWALSTVDNTADSTGVSSSLEALNESDVFIAHTASYNDGEDVWSYLKVSVSANGGTSWTHRTALTGLSASDLSLKVLSTSTFLLSWYDTSGGDLEYITSTTGGASWSLQSTIDSTGSVGLYPSLDAIDANTVFITHLDSSESAISFASSGYAPSSGTYTSGAIDLGGSVDLTTVGLTETVTGGANIIGWGDNSSGQLGNGETLNNTKKSTTTSGIGTALAVVSNRSRNTSPFSLALLADGTVKAWGYNGTGQLGDGSVTQRPTPITVSGLTTVTAIAAGGQHSLALLSDGTVKAWGYNGNGQLGDGSVTQRTTPVSVSGITTANPAVAIAASELSSYALLADGTVKAWGYNGSGQLGDGSVTQRTTPVSVSGITTANPAVAIAAGGNISATKYSAHALALLADGTVQAWGSNQHGELGDSKACGTNYCTTPVAVSGITNGTAVAAGGGSDSGLIDSAQGGYSLALLSDGTIKGWGYNGVGQLGTGATSAQELTPVAVSGISTATAIVATSGQTSGHSMALLADGTVKTWGYNFYGQLGDGSTTNRATPVTATAITNATAIGASPTNSLAITGGVRVKMRAATTSGGLSSATYVPVPMQTGHPLRRVIPSTLDSNQWVQYQLDIVTASGLRAPKVEEVIIYYPTTTSFDFSLSASPNSGSLGLTGSLSSTITATVGAYDSLGAVNFSYAVSPSVPNGPTVSLSSSSCTPSGAIPSCSVTMDITRPANAVTGNYTITIYGDNGTLTRQTSYTLAVLPPLDFSLSLSSSSGEVIRGFESTSYIQTVLTVQYLGGEDEIVGISSNEPAGINFNLSPTACSPAPGSCLSTITMSAQSGVASGDYVITITGTAAISGEVRTTAFTLRVRTPLDYSVSVLPSSGALFQGNSTTSTLTASYIGGVAEGVSFANFSSASNPLAFSSLPAVGMISVSFSGVPCTLGPSQTACAKTITFSTSSNTTPGVYTITITGVSSITGTTRSTTYTLNVSGPFDFTMAYPVPPCASSTVCAGTAEQGTSMVVSFDITSVSAAGENVVVSVGGLPANTTASITYAPNPCIPSLGNPCTVTIAISPATNAPIGTFGLNIEGRSSQQVHLITYSLTIVQGFTFDIAVNPTSGFAMKGGAALSVLVNVGLVTGVGKQVDLTVDISPPGSGVAVSFPSGSSCTPNCQRQISFTAPISAITGVYAVTVRGSYGTQTQEDIFALTVADPFDFSLNLSSTQGSVLQGDMIQTGATITWLSGGTGADTVSLSASVIPVPTTGSLGVDFTPSVLTNVSQANSPQISVVTMSPSGDLTSNSYRVVIMAMSGTTIKTQAYNLTVGTTLDFTLAPTPDNERVLQGSQSGSITFLVTNTSPTDQPSANDISFDVGDSSKYKLPKGVTVIPSPISSCSLGAVIGSTCSSVVVFNVDATAISGTYNIPIMGSSGFVKRLTYFTLKIGPLNLITYISPDFFTDPHQRPQVEFSWSPSVVFAGDTVQLSATSSMVYVTGQPGLFAQTPVTAMNAASVWSGIGPVPALPEVSIAVSSSGLLNATLQVTDATGTSCYTSDSSGNEPCACRVTSADIGGGTLDKVSAPRPFFREVKP